MCALCDDALPMANASPMNYCQKQKQCAKFRDRCNYCDEKTSGTAFLSEQKCVHVNRSYCLCGVSFCASVLENYGEDLRADIASASLVYSTLFKKLNLTDLFVVESDTNFTQHQSVQHHWPQKPLVKHPVIYNFNFTKSILKRARISEEFRITDALQTSSNIFLHITPLFHNYTMKVQRLRRYASYRSAHGLEHEKSESGSTRLFYYELSNCHSHRKCEPSLPYSQIFWYRIRIYFRMIDEKNSHFSFKSSYSPLATTKVVIDTSVIFVLPADWWIFSQEYSCNLNCGLRCCCDPTASSSSSNSSSSDTSDSNPPLFPRVFSISVPLGEGSSSACSPRGRETIPSFVTANEAQEKPLSSPNFYQSCDLNLKRARGSQVVVPAARGFSSDGHAVSPCETNPGKSKRRVRQWFGLRSASVAVPHRLVVMLWLLCPIIAAASAIKEPPRLTVPEAFEMLTVPRSDDRSLLCPIIGTPTPIFEWYKDGESVPEDARWDRITVSESRLRLKDAQLEDSGRYVCTAVNGFGKLNYTFVVTVNDPLAPPSLHEDQGAPTLLQVYPPSPGPPIIKKASQSVTLKCRVGGIPEPVVVWYKDGIPVSMDGSPALSRSNDLHTLHIGRLHRSDAGLYTCTATNLYGPVTANWTLRVKGSGGGAPSSPALTHPPLRVHNASVVEGDQEAVLICDGASGSGEPHVKWLRARGSSSGGIGDSVGDPFIDWKGREFAVLPPSSVVMKLPGIFVTKLVIEHPEQEHAGEYVCMATTTKGTAVGTANLTVLPRGPGSILLVVMGLLGSIAVIAVVTAVVATYRRRRRQQRHVGAFKPAPTAGDYKGHPSSQASSNLLQADDCQRQPIGKNGMASSVNGGPYPPRYVRPPGVQGRVGDSGALLPHQEGMMARYQEPSSASVYLSGQQALNDSSGGSDYKPPLTPLNDFQQQYQQIAAPQQYQLPAQQHQYQLPQQQHLLTSTQQCGLQQHPPPPPPPQQPQQYQTSMPQQQQQQQVPPPQFQYHQLDVI